MEEIIGSIDRLIKVWSTKDAEIKGEIVPTDRLTIGLGRSHEHTGENKGMVKKKVKGENMRFKCIHRVYYTHRWIVRNKNETTKGKEEHTAKWAENR